ncbi:MAG: peptidoglycan editing factor PgeF [Ignavibacteriales bacterium]|nr:peptidoglycan editing factor PgeF [Ignavibacteriales bacterium]
MSDFTADQVPIVTSEMLGKSPELRFGISTRKGGVSGGAFGMNLSYNVGDDRDSVRQNRLRFFGSLGIVEANVAYPMQCHSGVAKEAPDPGSYAECDALVTNKSGVYLAITVADCVPIFLWDSRANVVAAIHAGWRGTVARIVGTTVNLMQKQFGAHTEHIVGFIGPAAGACCYEIGHDVANQFNGANVAIRNGRTFVDLKKANLDHMVEMGVSAGNIEMNTTCTICSPETCHSFRRDTHRSGRMMGVVGIKP